MPTSNTSSPVKRPGLARRALSSHAVVTRTSSDSSDTHLQKAPAHRPRAHVVGGGHRSHGRNPSFGKNLNKLQRHTSAGHITSEATVRHHQRKKSAPATPAASPRGGHHVRWDSGLNAGQAATSSIKRNNSSPALRNPRRNSSGVLAKKALVTGRPATSSGKKKTVGFELGVSDNDDDDDEGEWEDTTQSPESTRRSSVAQSKDSVENTAVLVDPLTFVKRPYPQVPRAASSLPESACRSFSRDAHSPDGSDQSQEQPVSEPEERKEEITRSPEHSDIAARLLSPSHSARAPPAMSSISATVKPAPVDTISRNASLTNLAGPDGLRRPLFSSTATLANTPGNQTNATSSSMEGGVSRFIINNKNRAQASSRTDSDPNTPSSFLPHYHPQTPPSPNRGVGKHKASPPSRPPGTEPPSRTQQKLWLQRTAALNTSPPDSHGMSTAVSPSAMDTAFIASHGRAGSGVYEASRALVNGSSRTGGDAEAKHIRKAYEKIALELSVVRRFQSPTGDSFARLAAILNDSKAPTTSNSDLTSALGKPIKLAPALAQLQQVGKQQRDSPSPEPRQLISRKTSDLKKSVSQTYLEDADEPSDSNKSQHPSQRILSTSDDGAHGTTAADEDFGDSYFTSESDMMIRRMWESREVATHG